MGSWSTKRRMRRSAPKRKSPWRCPQSGSLPGTNPTPHLHEEEHMMQICGRWILHAPLHTSWGLKQKIWKGRGHERCGDFGREGMQQRRRWRWRFWGGGVPRRLEGEAWRARVWCTKCVTVGRPCEIRVLVGRPAARVGETRPDPHMPTDP